MRNSKYFYTKVLKVKPSGAIVFLMIWFLLDLGGLFFLGYGLISEFRPFEGFWFLWILLFIGGIIALNMILWNIRGKEVIHVTDSGIIIKTTGNLFSSTNNIQYYELEGIDFDNDKDTPLWIKFWGFGGGKIVFRYLGTGRRIGPDLELSDAGRIVHNIRQAVELAKGEAIEN